MKLDNFKELLLKKSVDNDNLQILIKYMRDDYLVNHVVESLEKMAASYSKKNPNASVKHFAANMNNFKSGMIHDALSHHASHYKAALDAGDNKAADDHMRQIFKTIHMSEKFTKDGLNDHSSGRLKIDAIDPKPWERSAYTNKNDAGKFKTDTQGWKRHGTNINYDWLREAPHESYKDEVSRHGNNKAYPLEEMKVNGKYIDIADVEHKQGKHTPHPFDSHPIFQHYNESPNSHNADKKAQYLEQRETFHGDEKGGKAQYRDKLANMSKEDYANRGTEKSAPIHKEVEGLETQQRAKAPQVAEGPAGKPISQSELQSKLASIKAKSAALKIRRGGK